MLRPNSGKVDLEREREGSRKGWSVEGRSDSSVAGICRKHRRVERTLFFVARFGI